MSDPELGQTSPRSAPAGPKRCLDCKFWDHKKDHDGFCRRSAPQPSGRENEITRWRQTHAEDWCGEGEHAAAASPRVACGACRFWFRPEPGIDPLEHGGRFSDWWQHAGLCRRRAPHADAELGGRSFWRATHDEDHCGDAVAK